MENALTETGVLLDDRKFFIGKLAGLEQHSVRDADFTDIVKLGRLFQQVEDSLIQPERGADDARVLANAKHVLTSIIIAKLGGSGQAVNDVAARGLQLRRATPNFIFQILVVAKQLILVRLD